MVNEMVPTTLKWHNNDPEKKKWAVSVMHDSPTIREVIFFALCKSCSEYI
jgi:hypothetical protein